jgi:hypothetical protein
LELGRFDTWWLTYFVECDWHIYAEYLTLRLTRVIESGAESVSRRVTLLLAVLQR